MHGLIFERGSFGANPGAKDLAKHLYTRMSCGKVLILADKPASVLSALRKQWLKLARKVQCERAATMNAVSIKELSAITSQMHNLRFTTQWSADVKAADVYITTVDKLLQWPPECSTMYVTCKVELEVLHMVTAWMPKGALVVCL